MRSAAPGSFALLIVDDAPDVHLATRLALRGLHYKGRPVEMLSASSGREAIDFLRVRDDIGVVLLDVVMESLRAGLDACRFIREELGNRMVRILLRTGESSVAREKGSIEQYDIDGYLPKAEVTVTRLYAAVRTALKGWDELCTLERHRAMLHLIHERATALHAFDPLELTMQRILQTAQEIARAPFGLLYLETSGRVREAEQHLVHPPGADPLRVQTCANRLKQAEPSGGSPEMQAQGGLLVPLAVTRELGQGWLYVEGDGGDDIVGWALPLLAAQAANALYATLAQRALTARKGPFYDELIA